MLKPKSQIMNRKTYALHIGLNGVDPDCYANNWEGTLNCCEADAKVMQDITKKLNYKSSKVLLTKAATRNAFFIESSAIQAQLQAEDLFVLTFSGHGGQVLDTNGDEKDGWDETWCFYDGQLLDDQVHDWLKTFKEGIRIFIITDSCHSGTMLKEDEASVRKWGRRKPRIKLEGVKATVCLFSSSQEEQFSREKGKHGLFTQALLDVWDEAYYEGNYAKFYQKIVARIPRHKEQTPNYLIGGPDNPYFKEGKPFCV